MHTEIQCIYQLDKKKKKNEIHWAPRSTELKSTELQIFYTLSIIHT